MTSDRVSLAYFSENTCISVRISCDTLKSSYALQGGIELVGKCEKIEKSALQNNKVRTPTAAIRTYKFQLPKIGVAD